MTARLSVRAAAAGMALLAATGLAGRQHPAAATDRAGDRSPGKLVLVLDSSGSMKERAADGRTKIAAAKQALTTTVRALPDDQPVGLRVFGATVFSKKDPGACRDTQLKVPVATGNRAQLQAAVGRYRPYGETPIGTALRAAGKDLGSTGKRSILLVSDGVPTCEPPPCDVARQLVADGIDLKINVVGLDVDSRARSALRCIADAGNGVYYDIDNTRDLTKSLVQVATRAARPFVTIGQPVTGSPSASGAPQIRNGDWLDKTVGTQPLFYRIKRTYPGSMVNFSATFRAPDKDATAELSLSLPDGTSCGSDGNIGQLGTFLLVNVGATASPFMYRGVKPTDPCATAPEVIARVAYDGMPNGVPVEMRVLELPPAANAVRLPPAITDPSFREPARTTPRDVQGGTSFGDAPRLRPGSYRDSIVQGETLTYQVELDWGDRLDARVRFPVLRPALADAVTGNPYTALEIYGPGRMRAGQQFDNGGGTQAFLSRSGATLAAGTAPVNLRQGTGIPGLAGADAAGLYTVTVYLDRSRGGRSIPVPFTLDLQTTGTAGMVPDFESATASPRAPTPSGDAATPRSGGGPVRTDQGRFPVVAVLGGLGALFVLLLAGGAVVLRRRARG